MARSVYGNKLTVNGNAVPYTMVLPRGCSDAAGGATGRRAIIVQHGHGGDSTMLIPSSAFADHTRTWADRGFVVAGIDSGVSAWFDQDAMDRVAALRTHLVTGLGCKTKVGLSGWSMGGGTALCFAMLNPTLVAGAYVFDPALDLRWVGSAAGYTPPYSTGSVTPAPAWQSELAGDYPAGTASHDPMQNISTFRDLVPIVIGFATDDSVLPHDSASYFVGQVNDPAVVLRDQGIVGGHQGAITHIPASETADFFENNWVD